VLIAAAFDFERGIFLDVPSTFPCSGGENNPAEFVISLVWLAISHRDPPARP
jgi:hypothetical protein